MENVIFFNTKGTKMLLLRILWGVLFKIVILYLRATIVETLIFF